VVLIERCRVVYFVPWLVPWLVLAAGCSESLFDAHSAPDGGGAVNVPATCPAPCLADAAADFNGTPGGAGGKWRYLDDHRDRTWTAMTGSAMAMTGADAGNHITTCAAHPTAPACSALPGALLVSSAGATSAADPAIELSVSESQVVQLTVRAFVASGADQTIRIYRNSREDVLASATAAVGAGLDRAIVLDALAGDRFVVAVAPTARGATDVGLHVFASPTGARFPSSCQLALPFTRAAGNTVENLCGAAVTHSVDSTDMMTPPALAMGPFAELGNAADIAADTYFKTGTTLDKSHDITVQFWVKLRALVDTYAAWPFSDLDLNEGGGLGIAVYETTGLTLEVSTCSSPDPLAFASATTAYPAGGGWQFVRVVHTGGNVNVCLNGRRMTSFALAPGLLRSTFPPDLGKNVVWSPTGAFFDGQLDDVRVLTGALPCE
jgi:hypothetical protein